MRLKFQKLKEDLLKTVIICVLFISVLSLFDYTHWNGIHEEEDKNIAKKIFNRYYFITTTISSVGYGDISPKSYICKFIVSLLHILVAVQIIHIIGTF